MNIKSFNKPLKMRAKSSIIGKKSKSKKNPKAKLKKNKKSINYKNSGVDVDAGDALVDWLQSSNETGLELTQPHADKVVAGIGGFASLFRINFSNYKKPCLVTCTDGVGTKVKLAAHFKDYSGVGQDLVAMCVNDLICTGGDPLMFLDYYATGKLDLNAAKEFLVSVRRACVESDCALVGGETAEMPGVYQKNDFDCAGFAVGVVDEEKSIGRHRVKSGDILIGVSSSGFHSNGYSLLRKVFAKDLKKYRDILLKPTALYVKLAKDLREMTSLHALAHITGGGIENIPRVIPENLTIKLRDWKWPEIFELVQKRTKMTREEMQKTLNCGVGLVVVVPAKERTKVSALIEKHNFKVYDLGEVS